MRMKYLGLFLLVPLFAFCNNGEKSNSNDEAIAGIASPTVHQRSTYKVLLEEDVVYAKGLSHDSVNSHNAIEMDLMLDIYLPDNELENRPLYLFIHGGGFSGGSKQQESIKQHAQYFASRGWVFVSADYRLKRHMGTIPAAWVTYSAEVPAAKKNQFLAIYPAIRDAKAALRWLYANADTYHINTDFVTVGGGSAGAITAIALGVSRQEDYCDELSKDQDPTLSTTQLESHYKVHTIIDYWGSKIALEILKNMDGVERFDSDDPPLMVVHGTEDPTVPYSSAVELKAIYDKNQVPIAYYPIVGKKHGVWGARVDGKDLPELSFDFIVEQQALKVE